MKEVNLKEPGAIYFTKSLKQLKLSAYSSALSEEKERRLPYQRRRQLLGYSLKAPSSPQVGWESPPVPGIGSPKITECRLACDAEPDTKIST